MKIDLTKSGLNKWSIIGLYLILVLILFAEGIKDYSASWNQTRQLGYCLAYSSGDTEGYIAPMENYIQTGQYYLNDPQEESVGRGPYYAVYYYIFRQFLNVPASFDAVAILQILWFALAIVLLMLLLVRYIHYKSLVWLIPVLVLFIPLEIGLTTRILTETLVLCQLICFFFFYERFVRTNSWWQLGWAALFLSMACVMKPYLLPIFAFCFLDWAIANKILCLKKWCQFVAVMSLPLVLICLPFTIRNAVKLHTFAPMQNTMFAGGKNDTVAATARKMVRVWGEFHLEWESNALGSYFMPAGDCQYEGELPQSIFVDAYTAEDLSVLAQGCQRYQQMEESAERDSLGCTLVATMHTYMNAYKTQHPLWRVKATFKQMKYLIGLSAFAPNHRHSGLRSLISNGLSFSAWLLYYLVLFGGAIGLILIAIYCPPLRILTWVMLWLLLFFSGLLAGEHRFFHAAEYCCLGGLIYAIDCIITKITRYAR